MCIGVPQHHRLVVASRDELRFCRMTCNRPQLLVVTLYIHARPAHVAITQRKLKFTNEQWQNSKYIRICMQSINCRFSLTYFICTSGNSMCNFLNSCWCSTQWRRNSGCVCTIRSLVSKIHKFVAPDIPDIYVST